MTQGVRQMIAQTVIKGREPGLRLVAQVRTVCACVVDCSCGIELVSESPQTLAHVAEVEPKRSHSSGARCLRLLGCLRRAHGTISAYRRISGTYTRWVYTTGIRPRSMPVMRAP